MRLLYVITSIVNILIIGLIIPVSVYGSKLDQNDVQYELRVFPAIFEEGNQYQKISNLLERFMNNRTVEECEVMCKEADFSYKTIRSLGKNISTVKPGVVYKKYSQMVNALSAIRNASLLLILQSCISDPNFENPEVWNSLMVRWKQLDVQLNEISTGLEEELSNISSLLQEE